MMVGGLSHAFHLFKVRILIYAAPRREWKGPSETRLPHGTTPLHRVGEPSTQPQAET